MSNFTELYALDDEMPKLAPGNRRTARRCWLAKYHLPVSWLALFDLNDMRHLARFEGDGPWPYLVSRIDTAVPRLRSRVAALKEIFGPEAAEFCEILVNELVGSKQAYVVLDTQDIGSMVADGEAWGAELAQMLHAFREPPPDLIRSKAGALRLDGDSAGPGWRRYLARFPLEDRPQGDLPEFVAGPDAGAA